MKIKINGKHYLYFNDVSIDTSLDSVASTFGFTAKFDDSNPLHRELFRPLSYHRVEFLGDNNRPISTGTILVNDFNSEAAPSLVTFSGYSLGGVLEDCQIPLELYPLESNNRTLKEISERLLSYFGLKLIIYDEVSKECNQIIAKSVAEPEETIKDYLAKIAAQKNVIVSHDIYGNVIMFRPKTNSPSKGSFYKENTVNMRLSVDGQSMHSSISTLRQPTKPKKGSTDILSDDYDPLAGGGDDILSDDTSIGGSKKKSKILLPVDTIYNPLIKVKRPKVDKLSSGDIADTRKGANNAIANELKSIALSFELHRWEPISIGDIIEVQNPELYLFEKNRWMVSGTIINESGEVRTSSITCVLPETFTGQTPKNIFA